MEPREKEGQLAIHLSERVRFGSFELNLGTGELVGNEPEVGGAPTQKVLLREQPFQILRILIDRQGGIVTRDEIKKVLWSDETIVDFDRSINVAIAILRKAVGDTAENPKYIETLPRRGYRLIAAVQWESTTETPNGEDLQTSAPLPASRSGGLTGTRISHYRVPGVLGGGGMGVVYRAENLKLARPVALKFLPEEVAEQAAIQRFEREAQTASALNHTNICTIYGIAEYEGKPFIVMELLEGEALSTRLAQSHGPLALTTALDVAIQVCSGLQAAHATGIIHRGVNPSNIFLTEVGPAEILRHRPCSAPELRYSGPRRLNEIISKALEKDRAQRYQSATEMREDLLRAQKELRSIGGLSRNWLAIVASVLILATAGA